MRELSIGDHNNRIEVVDKDRLCYLVKLLPKPTENKYQLCTISKSLVQEFADYLKSHPKSTPEEARTALNGHSNINSFEYGYRSTLHSMATLILSKKSNEAYTPTDSKQIIYYGAPGTGKSYKIKEILKNTPIENICRTTFHPDSDYSTFVGAYKPTMRKRIEKIYTKDELTNKLAELKEEATYSTQKFGAKYWDSLHKLTRSDKKGILSACGMSDNYIVELDKGIAVGEELQKDSNDSSIIYSFVPQAFINAYIKAYQTKENVFLVIEEINRGNCAQIFGDLFQLLDRDQNGFSEYPIKADNDLKDYLEEILGENEPGILKGELCLPPNLYIYATMNTSDQSLFPIDSAFKRRWDWEYEPIKYNNTNWEIHIQDQKYSWVAFQKEVNQRIYDISHSEDKMLGDYFVNPRDGIITEKILVNKILFYLWNDICKDGDGDIFKISETEEVTFSDLYGEEGSETLTSMMKHLKLSPILNNKDLDKEIENNEYTGVYTKRHLKVTFPDGIVYEDNNSTNTLIKIINKIGPEEVYKLNLMLSDYPFISKEKLDDDGRGYGNSQRELDGGFFLTTKLSTDAKLAKVQEIAQRLNYNLNVSIIEI